MSTLGDGRSHVRASIEGGVLVLIDSPSRTRIEAYRVRPDGLEMFAGYVDELPQALRAKVMRAWLQEHEERLKRAARGFPRRGLARELPSAPNRSANDAGPAIFALTSDSAPAAASGEAAPHAQQKLLRESLTTVADRAERRGAQLWLECSIEQGPTRTNEPNEKEPAMNASMNVTVEMVRTAKGKELNALYAQVMGVTTSSKDSSLLRKRLIAKLEEAPAAADPDAEIEALHESAMRSSREAVTEGADPKTCSDLVALYHDGEIDGPAFSRGLRTAVEDAQRAPQVDNITAAIAITAAAAEATNDGEEEEQGDGAQAAPPAPAPAAKKRGGRKAASKAEAAPEAPKSFAHDPRVADLVGKDLVHKFRDKAAATVRVVEDGFTMEGQHFATGGAVMRALGVQANFYTFFGLEAATGTRAPRTGARLESARVAYDDARADYDEHGFAHALGILLPPRAADLTAADLPEIKAAVAKLEALAAGLAKAAVVVELAAAVA